jgi:hypothetical protein
MTPATATATTQNPPPPQEPDIKNKAPLLTAKAAATGAPTFSTHVEEQQVDQSDNSAALCSGRCMLHWLISFHFMHLIHQDIAVILPVNRHNYSLVASPLEQEEDEEEDEEVPEATKSPTVFFFFFLTENLWTYQITKMALNFFLTCPELHLYPSIFLVAPW